MYENNPRNHTLMSLPLGQRAATRDTLKVMRDIVRAYKTDPSVRQKATELTRYLEQKDWFGEVYALWDFVKNRVRYVRDIAGVETLQTPDVILQNLSGDCDDKAMLLAALLQAIDHPVRFVAVGFQPGSYSHVYPETLIGRAWMALETTEPVDIGWSPPGIVERYVMDI